MINFFLGLIILLIISHLLVLFVYELFQLTGIIHYVSSQLYFLIIGFIGTLLAIFLTNLILQLFSEKFELRLLPMIFVAISWISTLNYKLGNPVHYYYRGIGAILALVIGYFVFVF